MASHLGAASSCAAEAHKVTRHALSHKRLTALARGLLLVGVPGTSPLRRPSAPAPEALEDPSDSQDGLAPPVRTEVRMARITVEDCVEHVDNRFALCILATRRARQLAAGATPHVDAQRNKAAVVALREVALGKVRFEGDVREALSRPPPARGALEAAVTATESDQAKGRDPFRRSERPGGIR